MKSNDEEHREDPAAGKARARAVAGRLLWDATARAAAASFLGALRREGVEAAPIKGLVTSALLYADPLERAFSDVDLLVRARDLDRVVALARRSAHRVVHDSKQLANVNVVVPPGVAMDLRASIGPPGLARVDADDLLARATWTRGDGVVACEYLRLSDHDQLLQSIVDAVMDKLAVKAELHVADLVRAAIAWAPDVEAFADHAARAGLVNASAVAMAWVARATGDPHVGRLAAALARRSPRLASIVARALASRLERDPDAPIARVGVRFLADSPWRAAFSLALGAYGSAIFRARHRGKDPWREPSE